MYTCWLLEAQKTGIQISEYYCDAMYLALKIWTETLSVLGIILWTNTIYSLVKLFIMSILGLNTCLQLGYTITGNV